MEMAMVVIAKDLKAMEDIIVAMEVATVDTAAITLGMVRAQTLRRVLWLLQEPLVLAVPQPSRITLHNGLSTSSRTPSMLHTTTVSSNNNKLLLQHHQALQVILLHLHQVALLQLLVVTTLLVFRVLRILCFLEPR